MNQDAIVVIRFKDVENDDEIRDTLEKRCHHLAQEFPETRRYELTLTPMTLEVSAQGHVTGKDIDAAAHATSNDLRQAGERVIDKLERELRRLHDKKIFSRRREAQRATGKRTS
jgi:ribosome-associated translation inhibitor RaiA